MESASLEDMVVQMPELDVNGVKLKMRKVTLSDQAWLQRQYGDKLNEVFEMGNITEICRVIYRQLDQDSKKNFTAVMVKEIDDEGEEVELKVSGPERLMREVSDQRDVMALITAFSAAMEASNPKVDPEAKKPQAQQKK